MHTRWIMAAALAGILCLGSTKLATAQGRSHVQKSSNDVKRSLAELTENVRRSVVEVKRGDKSVALATAVAAPGYLVTKASEIEGEGELMCRLWDERVFAAEIVAIDEPHDLVLLRTAAEELDPVDLSLDRQPAAGSFLVAVGMAGQPIGLGLVEVDTRRFPLRSPRQTNRGYLGVNCSPDEDSGGLMVEQVTDDSGARRAGVRRGDIILSINEQKVSNSGHLVDELRKHKEGDQVELTIRRGTENLNIQATLGPVQTTGPYDQWGGGPFSKRRFGFESVIAHDVNVAPHQCGGPVLDTEGRVVGINIARALRVVCYALPADVVRDFVDKNLPASSRVPSSTN